MLKVGRHSHTQVEKLVRLPKLSADGFLALDEFLKTVNPQ